MLTFEPDGHQYFWRGQLRPSVTQIIALAHDFRFVSDDVLEAAQERGSYAHSLCEYDDMGDLDDDEERDGEHWGYLIGWRKFMADMRPNWSFIERPFYSDGLGVATTPDRGGILEAINTTQRWIVEIKTSQAPHKAWGLQTAAQRHIVAENDPMFSLARRASVRLSPDGTYKFDEWKNPLDMKAFIGLLNLLNWTKS